MARPDTNREEKKAQIVRVATQVFARYGYEGTTNKLIAEEMQQQTGGAFSPALIYHYFESKAELFKAVMRQFPAPQALGATIREGMKEPPEIFFRLIATAWLEILEDPITHSIIKMIWSEGPRQPEIIGIASRELIPAVLLPLVHYITLQMALGRLKHGNPMTLVFLFFGPLLQRVLLPVELIPDLPFLIPSRAEFVEAVVSGFLHGVASS